MISSQEKSKIVEKILKSPEFANSERYSNLLEYLFKASLDGNYIKETTIASDLFPHSTHNSQSENPIVRVYISNLRKKLSQYYLSTGKEDTIRLRIPRGHYHIEFYHCRSEKKSAGAKLKKVYFPLSVLLILLLLLSSLYFWNKSRSAMQADMVLQKDNPIWTEFFNPEISTLIVIGDFFFVYKNSPDSSRRIFIRDTRINSEKDYEKYLQEYLDNKEKIFKLEFTYLTKSSLLALIELLPFLKESTNKKIIKLSSELDWADLAHHNVIYIGNFKSLFNLENILSNLQFHYNTNIPFQLYLLDSKGDTIKTYKAIPSLGGPEKDYSIICKIPGPRGKSILLIVGSDEVGIIEALRKVMDPNFATQIMNEFLNNEFQQPLYFRMILRAEGIERTGFQSKIVFFEIIDNRAWPITLK